MPYEQWLGDSGKETLPFYRKKPPEGPGLGRGSYLLRPVGGEGKKKGLETNCGREPETNHN